MDQDKRKVVLYIAMSLDGFIAGPNDDISFLETAVQEGEDYGYADFIDTVDTVVMGKRTYDKVLSMGYEYPHKHLESYIINRYSNEQKGNIRFYNGSLYDLINQLRLRSGKNIFCDGGAYVVNELLKHDLIDEFIVSIIPVVLGNGLRLFNNDNMSSRLKLISSQSYKSGLVKLHYYNLAN